MAEPRINGTTVRMPVAPALRRPFFFDRYESKRSLLLTMQLLRHAAYQLVGGCLVMANQLLRDETYRNSSRFVELDTEIRRIVVKLREIPATSHASFVVPCP
jgi:hypothetical protein